MGSLLDSLSLLPPQEQRFWLGRAGEILIILWTFPFPKDHSLTYHFQVVHVTPHEYRRA